MIFVFEPGTLFRSAGIQKQRSDMHFLARARQAFAPWSIHHISQGAFP